MSSNGPKDDDPVAPQELFPYDEMSTGETSSLLRRANQVTGAPDPQPKPTAPPLKPMTGAQLAFRPSAPSPQGKTGTNQFAAFKPADKPTTGAHAAYKPTSGSHAAVKPATGQQPAFKPGDKPTTGQQPAFRPSAPPPQGKTGTNQFAAFKPSEAPKEPEEAPVFDTERLQSQIRAMALTDSALGRAAKGAPKPAKLPASAVEDTFVKRKMQQAESKVVDFDLDDDLG